MKRRIENRLGAEREQRGWTQQRAAEAAGISRQSYAAIEAGRSIPSTEVSLRLARALGVPVERLFTLAAAAPHEVEARWAGRGRAVGSRVRLIRVAGDWVAHSSAPDERPARAADGVIVSAAGDRVRVRLLPQRPPAADLAVVGCDPSFGIIAEVLRRDRGIEVSWSALGSRAALDALARGEAHIAGAHLLDPVTGEVNEPWVREVIPFACTRVTFSDWEQGLLLPAGNPAGIGGVADLGRGGLRLLNREVGSGSRLLLDESLATAGVVAEEVAGYTTTARSHFAVGEAIASGLADVGVGIRAAAAAFGLEHIALRSERYELVIPDHFLDLPAVGALLDVLRLPEVRAQVEAMQGYDAAQMGLPA